MLGTRGSSDLRLWVYVSQSCIDNLTEQAVGEIVSTSRARNAELQVTGALVFTGQRFAQLLEGPERGVAELRTAIVGDRRHRRVTTLCWSFVRARMFEDWSLVYSGASRYMASFLNRVELDLASPPAEVREPLMRLFSEFAKAKQRERHRH